MKPTAAVQELMQLPWQVLDPNGEFVGGYPTKADAAVACKEMNDYAGYKYWQVAKKGA